MSLFGQQHSSIHHPFQMPQKPASLRHIISLKSAIHNCVLAEKGVVKRYF